MSRVGKKPVRIPEGLKVSLADHKVVVEGGKAKLEQWIDPSIEVAVDEQAREVSFRRRNDLRRTRALHGLYRVLVANMMEGLTKGFQKKLSIVGVGYNAQLKGTSLSIQIGFCHPVVVPLPPGITVELPNNTTILVKGIDKHAVGQFSADIRRIRPPEPYKGKGIRYDGEVVRHKVGKSLGA